MTVVTVVAALLFALVPAASLACPEMAEEGHGHPGERNAQSHHGHKAPKGAPKDAAEHCICIACVPGATAPMPDLAGATLTSPEHYSIAALDFATGVSATHGPRKTANFATGPPALGFA